MAAQNSAVGANLNEEEREMIIGYQKYLGDLLTSGFYFTPHFDLTSTVQQWCNKKFNNEDPNKTIFDERYVWNTNILKDF
jgi:hypothetical protein